MNSQIRRIALTVLFLSIASPSLISADEWEYDLAKKTNRNTDEITKRKTKLYVGWNFENHKTSNYWRTNAGIMDSTLSKLNTSINRLHLKLTVPFSVHLRKMNLLMNTMIPFSTGEQVSDFVAFGNSQAQFASSICKQIQCS